MGVGMGVRMGIRRWRERVWRAVVVVVVVVGVVGEGGTQIVAVCLSRCAFIYWPLLSVLCGGSRGGTHCLVCCTM